ncbi:MAG: ribosome maturation factor RimP, partial [Acidimicrobiia bacterium]
SLLAVPISKLGVELVDVEFTGGTLRVLVDTEHEPLSGGVDTSTLATVNRAIGPILDEDDPIPGRYTLEVSSPGVERRLARPEHYQRAIGENVVVKLVSRAQEYRRVRGALTGANQQSFTVAVKERDGIDLTESEEESIPYHDVERTKTVFNWGPTPKPHSTPRKKKSKNSKKK